MEQLAHLKKQHGDNLQIAASIGGWTMSEPFHRIAATKAGREKFVQSLQKIQTRIKNKYEENYEFSGFDGFDIDWESFRTRRGI